ncbi:dinucleotide-utilizing protein [Moritella marina ATCC 15381]|uniref:Dinucleotide-utilizing protein n=1 Tax=Moritella marina ATCC 15381 TaxID=1202962 RepID=A0A5J6WJP6_MORMI|nr:ThiF family adenylyltransferase [Moritella marina]QFI37025.1 dinucleotide-utilizing protein [Moritella marina ATCC 15381]
METIKREVLFSRMIGLISESELLSLENKRVAVPGCGGTGFTYAECLIRMGVGNINIADADTFGPENMNRQFGCTMETVGLKKSAVLEQRLKSINPNVNIATVDFIDEDNIHQYLDGVDVVCDTLDFFVIEPRRLLYKVAREKNIPVIICCPVAFGVTSHIFLPNAMSFDEYFDINDQESEQDQLIKFGNGLTPSSLFKSYATSPSLDFQNKKVASLSSSCLMATSYGSNIALMLLLGYETGFKPVPYCYQFDIRSGQFEEVLKK